MNKLLAFGFLNIITICVLSSSVCVPEPRPSKLYVDGVKPHKKELCYDKFTVEIKADIEFGKYLSFHFNTRSVRPLKFDQNKLIVMHNNRRVFNRVNNYEIKTLAKPGKLKIRHMVEVYNPNKDPGYSSNYFRYKRGDKLILMGEDVIQCDGEYYDIEPLLFSFKE